MTGLLVAFSVLLGLAVGSFLNVVIWRVPRDHSVIRPASRCPQCEAPILTRDNVPVISWLVLRGKCRNCGAVITVRYLIVELLTAMIFVLLALRLGFHAALPAFFYLGAVGVALAAIDLELKRLPDKLTLPSYGVGVALLGVAAVTDSAGWDLVRGLLGMLALFTFYFALAFVYPAGMGFGDVKLSGVLGLYLGWLGWSTWLVGAFAGFLLGGLTGIALILAGRARRRTAIPFGPFMLVGALLAVLVGAPLARAYLRLTTG